MFSRNNRIWRKGLVFKEYSVASNQTRWYNNRILRTVCSVPWDVSWIQNYKLNIWVKVFKNWPSKICGRPFHFKSFKVCFPQILYYINRLHTRKTDKQSQYLKSVIHITRWWNVAQSYHVWSYLTWWRLKQFINHVRSLDIC